MLRKDSTRPNTAGDLRTVSGSTICWSEIRSDNPLLIAAVQFDLNTVAVVRGVFPILQVLAAALEYFASSCASTSTQQLLLKLLIC